MLSSNSSLKLAHMRIRGDDTAAEMQCTDMYRILNLFERRSRRDKSKRAFIHEQSSQKCRDSLFPAERTHKVFRCKRALQTQIAIERSIRREPVQGIEPRLDRLRFGYFLADRPIGAARLLLDRDWVYR